jgi:hypothetical protein
LDSKGRENFGGLCARIEMTRCLLQHLAQLALPTAAFFGQGFSFCAAAHVSPTSAIDLAEASSETDLHETAPVPRALILHGHLQCFQHITPHSFILR